jgi:hypothetical protein
MRTFLTPKGFLQYGGIILVLLGVLGFLGITGPTPKQSIFGSFWWFDNVENIAHTGLGIATLLLVFIVKNENLNRWVTVIVGAVALLIGLYNLGGEVMLAGANLESPADLVLHLLVGVWGIYAGFMGIKTTAPSTEA